MHLQWARPGWPWEQPQKAMARSSVPMTASTLRLSVLMDAPMLTSPASRRTGAQPESRMSAMWTAIFSRSSLTVCSKEMGEAPVTDKDFRSILEQKDVDAITIATPDHWHTPMAIAGLQAGKHVYVEKPCSHNPAEGEMLVQAQQKYRKLVQMGTQQRSSPHTIEIVEKIHEGIIGRPYFAKAWYCNVRKSIGTGKEVPVPPQLDWDLWQGPAPRRPYKDNVQPYNWHWFRIYGTGETLNNGTHEVDVCRWALGVDYPKLVTASGGRYHFKDDWQFYDTLVTSFEYEDSMISWEGKSCQGMKYYGRDRGSTIMGTNWHGTCRSRWLRDIRPQRE